MALAAFYQSRGRYPEAEQQVQVVIAANPKDVNARASHGQTLHVGKAS